LAHQITTLTVRTWTGYLQMQALHFSTCW